MLRMWKSKEFPARRRNIELLGSAEILSIILWDAQAM